jgi:peptidoglycan hydrolase-like protein with peptidoglycan-binding domain
MVKQAAGVGIIFSMLVLSGCATVNKTELSNQELRNKISVLESQLSEKDNEINSLKEMAAKNEPAAVESADQNAGVLDVKQIQTALTNAGYFDGVIDGKMGKKTRKAIKAFQKANNLHVDGRVGKNTSDVLKEYLNKKVK